MAAKKKSTQEIKKDKKVNQNLTAAKPGSGKHVEETQSDYVRRRMAQIQNSVFDEINSRRAATASVSPAESGRVRMGEPTDTEAARSVAPGTSATAPRSTTPPATGTSAAQTYPTPRSTAPTTGGSAAQSYPTPRLAATAPLEQIYDQIFQTVDANRSAMMEGMTAGEKFLAGQGKLLIPGYGGTQKLDFSDPEKPVYTSGHLAEDAAREGYTLAPMPEIPSATVTEEKRRGDVLSGMLRRGVEPETMMGDLEASIKQARAGLDYLESGTYDAQGLPMTRLDEMESIYARAKEEERKYRESGGEYAPVEGLPQGPAVPEELQRTGSTLDSLMPSPFVAQPQTPGMPTPEIGTIGYQPMLGMSAPQAEEPAADPERMASDEERQRLIDAMTSTAEDSGRTVQNTPNEMSRASRQYYGWQTSRDRQGAQEKGNLTESTQEAPNIPRIGEKTSSIDLESIGQRYDRQVEKTRTALLEATQAEYDEWQAADEEYRRMLEMMPASSSLTQREALEEARKRAEKAKEKYDKAMEQAEYQLDPQRVVEEAKKAYIQSLETAAAFARGTEEYKSVDPESYLSGEMLALDTGNEGWLRELSMAQTYLTEDQKRVMAWMRAQGHDDWAEEYYRDVLRRGLQEQREQDTQEAEKAYGEAHPVWGTITSIPKRSISGAASTIDNLMHWLTDHQYNTYGEAQTALRGASSTREGAKIAIGDSYTQALRKLGYTGEINTGVIDFIYDTAVSVLGDSYFNAFVGGEVGGLGILGATAFADTTDELVRRGVDFDRAMTLGMISGATEIITEKMHFDDLYALVGKGMPDAVLRIFQNVMSEGSEELTSEVVGIAAQAIALGDQSELNISIEDYMAQGMSREAAERQAKHDLIQQCLLAFAGGALGAAMGGTLQSGVGTVTRKLSEREYTRQYKQGLPEEAQGLYEAVYTSASSAGIDRETYTHAFDTMYRYGRLGVSFEKAQQLAGMDASVIGEDLARQIWQGGADVRKAEEQGDYDKRINYEAAGVLARIARGQFENARAEYEDTGKVTLEDGTVLSGTEASDEVERLNQEWLRAEEEIETARAEAAQEELDKRRTARQGAQAAQAMQTESTEQQSRQAQQGAEPALVQQTESTQQQPQQGAQAAQGQQTESTQQQAQQGATAAEEGQQSNIERLAEQAVAANEEPPEAPAGLAEAAEQAGQSQQTQTQETQAQQKTKARPTIHEYQSETQAKTAEKLIKMAREDMPELASVAETYNGPEIAPFISNYVSDAQVRSIETYKRAFDAIFDLGRLNMDRGNMTELTEKFVAASGMQESTRDAIFTAGRNAALADMTPGVKKLYTKKLTNEEAQMVTVLDQIGRAYGLQIVVTNTTGGEASGYYSGGRRIVVALDAKDGAIAQTGIHEMVHYLRRNYREGYNVLHDTVMKHLEQASGGDFDLDKTRVQRMKQYENQTKDMSLDEMIDYLDEEIVAEGTTAFLGDEKAVRSFVKNNYTLAQKIQHFLHEFVEKVKSIVAEYVKHTGHDEVAAMLSRGTEALQEVADQFDRAMRVAAGQETTESGELRTSGKASMTQASLNLTEREQQALDAVGAQIVQDGQFAYINPVARFNNTTFEESEWVTKRETAAETLARIMGVSVDKVLNYIDDMHSLAAVIAGDRARLDFYGQKQFSFVKRNSEYRWTVDGSTLCYKRGIYTATFDELQRQFADTAFDQNDMIKLREIMMRRGYPVACGFCYVEAQRKDNGRIIKNFVDRYNAAADAGQTQMEYGKTKIKYADVDPSFRPKVADFNTTTGLERVLKRKQQYESDPVKYAKYKGYSVCYDAYIAVMNNRGNSKPKLLETRAAYADEIVSVIPEKDIAFLNYIGGLRLQSFSDFELIHILDMMQVIPDMARRGLKSQAYTKVPEFAMLMGMCGVKINLSLVTDGLDANGNLIFNDVEGMPAAIAMAIRDGSFMDRGVLEGIELDEGTLERMNLSEEAKERYRKRFAKQKARYIHMAEHLYDLPAAEKAKLKKLYSQNVGTILVGKDDETIRAAMRDPRIDFIIPYHHSQWSKNNQWNLGTGEYVDYTKYQNEFVYNAEGKRVKADGNLYPGDYWTDTMTPAQYKARYLQLCEEQGRIPKFPQFLEEEGYWKVLGDYKMYDNEGNPAPQHVVGLDYDVEMAKAAMERYEGVSENSQVAWDALEEFKQWREAGRPGLKETKWKFKAEIRAMKAREEATKAKAKAREKEIKESGKIRLNLTSPAQMDAAYTEAVESGDEARQRELVEEAARRAMPDNKLVNSDGTMQDMYHGTNAYEPFTVFKRGKAGYLGPAIYLTTDEAFAKKYAYQNGGKGITYHAYAFAENPLIVTSANPAEEILRAIGARASVYSKRAAKAGSNETKILTNADMQKLRNAGYDAIIWKYGTSPVEVAVFNPEQVKSAEPVTRDDAGNVIPLSERFNQTKTDIRFNATSPVEQVGDLVAVHNTWGQDLLKMLRARGIPMASIAIVLARHGHSSFGDYSLIFGKDTIDPANLLNKAYGQDVWSPTVPMSAGHWENRRFAPIKERMERLPADLKDEAEYWTEELNNAGWNAMQYKQQRREGMPALDDMPFMQDFHDVSYENPAILAMYLQSNGQPVDADTKESDWKELQAKVPRDDFDKWLKILYGGEPFIPYGDGVPFYPEDIVRAMKRKGDKGIGATGMTALRAKGAKEYHSLDDIRADKKRLQLKAEDEYQKIERDLETAINQLGKTILQHWKPINGRAGETYWKAMEEAAYAYSKTENAASIRNVFDGEGITLTDAEVQQVQDVLEKARNIPVSYFEAKPERVIGLDEIKYVIAPDDAEQEVLDALKEAGIETRFYRAGDMEDRRRVLNELPTSIRFNATSPVEQVGDLVAQHNLNEDNALKVLYMGGIPMGSFAITKASIGHRQFGEISFIVGKDSIDPANPLNRVMGNDAYTPTMRNAKSTFVDPRWKALSPYINSLNEDLRVQVLLWVESMMIPAAKGGDAEGLYESAYWNTGMLGVYLLSQFKDHDPEYKRTEADGNFDAEMTELYDEFLNSIEAEGGLDQFKKDGEFMFNSQLHLEYSKYLPDIPGDDENQFIRQAWKYLIMDRGKKARYESEYSNKKTLAKFQNEVDEDQFVKWLRNALGDKPFIPYSTGIPNTLQGIVDAMRSAGDKGINAYGISAIRAKGAKEYKSLDAIRADKGRLTRISAGKYQQVMQSAQKKFDGLGYKLIQTGKISDSGAYQSVMEDAAYAYSKEETEQSVLDAFKQRGIELSSKEAQAVITVLEEYRNMPVDYFEAKPQRVIGLDEILYAIVPYNASQELLDALKKAGIETRFYKTGDMDDRTRVLNELPTTIRFSLGTESDGGDMIGEDGKVKMPVDLQFDTDEVRQIAQTAFSGAQKIADNTVNTIVNKRLEKAAGNIVKETQSKYKKEELASKMAALLAEYAKHGATDETFAETTKLAQDIIEASNRLDNTLREQYAGIRDTLRNAGISLTETQKQEVANVWGSVNEYRKQMMGTVKISNGGISLDSLWQQLCQQAPEFFDPMANEAAMPEALATFREAMKPRYENIYGMDRDAVAADLALRIQADLMVALDAREQAKKLYGMRQEYRNACAEAKQEEVKKKNIDRTAAFQDLARELRLAKERGDRKAYEHRMQQYRQLVKEEGMKELIAEAESNRRMLEENAMKTHNARERLTKKAQKMLTRLRKPYKGEHIPTMLQQTVIDVLNALDFAGEGTPTVKEKEFAAKLEAITGFYDKVLAAQSRGETAQEAEGTLITVCQKQVDDLRRYLTGILEGGKIRIDDMDFRELGYLNAAMDTINQTIDTINQLWRNERYGKVSDLAEATMEDLDAMRAQEFSETSPRGIAFHFLQRGMAQPETFGELMGKAGKTVIDSLFEGERVVEARIHDAHNYTRGEMEKAQITGYDIGEWKEHTHEFTTRGRQKVTMTDTMIMSLMLTAQRPQGLQHLLGNGMRIPSTKETGNQVKTIFLEPADISEITSVLTDKQRTMCRIMQKYLATDVAKWGNNVTQRLYLYDAFTEDTYWPLTSDPNVLKTQEPTADRNLSALMNPGFLKPLVEGANNPVIIQDAFNVYGRHIGEMANYAGLAEPIFDTLAMLNYVRKEEVDDNVWRITGTVKESMERALGRSGQRYLTNLIQDLNGARHMTDKSMIDKLLSNYKRYAVVGKIRVWIQQPTSIVRAAAEIDPRYLAAGLFAPRGTQDEMLEHSPLAWWKANGNYDTGLGKSLDQILYGDTRKRDAVMEKVTTFGGAIDPGKADDFAWTRMWQAVKLETKALHPELKEGTDAYWEHVRKRFEKIMDRTQVVDTVMHRSEMMRSTNAVDKIFTSFQAEPTTGYNLLLRSFVQYRRDGSRASLENLVKCAGVYVAGAMVTALAKGLVDAMRYRDDDKDWWDYMLGDFWKDWLYQALENGIGDAMLWRNMPYVQDILDVAMGNPLPETLAKGLTGQGWEYKIQPGSFELPQLQGIAALWPAAQKLYDYVIGGNTKRLTWYGAAKPMINAIGQLVGGPTGMLNTVETALHFVSPRLLESKVSYQSLTETYEALYAAIARGDKKKADSIRTELHEGKYGMAEKDDKAIDTGVAKALSQQDPRIADAYALMSRGQYEAAQAIVDQIAAEGFGQAVAQKAVTTYKSTMTGEAKKAYREAMGEGDEDRARKILEDAIAAGFATEADGEKWLPTTTEGAQLEASMMSKDTFIRTVESGTQADISAALQAAREAGTKDTTIAGWLNDRYKEEYIALWKSGRKAEANALGRRLQALGLMKELKSGTVNCFRDDYLKSWQKEAEKS